MNKKTIVFLSISLGIVTATVLTLVIVRTRSDSSPTVYHMVDFDSNGGSSVDSVSVKHGELLPRPGDPILNGYNLKSWFSEGEEWLFSVYRVTKDLTLKANWELADYTISYNLDGGKFEGEYATSYNTESSFDLSIPVKDSFVFGGWFTDSEKRIDAIAPGMYGDLILTARWYSNLLVESLDLSRGYVVVQGDETDNNKVSLLSKPMNNKYHTFIGWYDEFDKLISNENPFVANLKPNLVNKFYAKYMNDEQENIWNDAHGVNLKVYTDSDSNTEYATYGMFPQTVVEDSNLINVLENSSLTELSNYYYDGEYYINQKAKLDNTELVNRFDSDTIIVDGETYWFKYEPIRWTVFKDNKNSYELLSEKLLNTCTYQTSYNSFEKDGRTIEPNNYRYSFVREYLNSDFYNSSFVFNNSLIAEVEIDNSASTTASINNPYFCENTLDKVCLLSFKDYLTINPSSSSTPNRCFKTTDFSRIKDAKISFQENNRFCGYCWTRSPYWEVGTDRGYFVSKVNMNGTVNSDGIANNSYCIQPCITVSKELL